MNKHFVCKAYGYSRRELNPQGIGRQKHTLTAGKRLIISDITAVFSLAIALFCSADAAKHLLAMCFRAFRPARLVKSIPRLRLYKDSFDIAMSCHYGVNSVRSEKQCFLFKADVKLRFRPDVTGIDIVNIT